MVKTFSVDWLAQSFHDSKQGSETYVKRHVPCSVQPRPPTSYNRAYIQPKTLWNPTGQDTKTEELKDNFFGTSASRCASPISENSGYSSGYDSEAAASECPSIEDPTEGDQTGGCQRRIRTKFTPDQIEKLEKIFLKHKYLDASERVKTSQSLSLSETQVRTWFQNRRMKLKREVQELRAEYALPTMPHVLFPTALFHCYSAPRAPFPPTPQALPPMARHYQPLIPQHAHPVMPMQQFY